MKIGITFRRVDEKTQMSEFDRLNEYLFFFKNEDEAIETLRLSTMLREKEMDLLVEDNSLITVSYMTPKRALIMRETLKSMRYGIHADDREGHETILSMINDFIKTNLY